MDWHTTLVAILYTLEKDSIRDRLTSSSCVRCVWDIAGLFVDLDLAHENGAVTDQICLYAIPDDESPSKEDWLEAIEVAKGVASELNVVLEIEDAQ